MKRYEIVIHHIGGKYVKEVYWRSSGGTLGLVSEEEAAQIPMNYPEKEVFELHHSADCERVKSPFDGKYLYGRYINISSRISDEINRF